MLLFLLFILAVLLVSCGEESKQDGEGRPEPGPGDIPSVSQRGTGVAADGFRFVMDTGLYPVPELALPPKGQTFNDPNFNTPVTRVTDKAADGIEDPGISNEYAKSDPENSDGSLVVLRGNGGVWYIYDAKTLELLERLPDEMIGAPEFEPRWDPRDPSVFYYLYGAELRSYNTETRKSTTVHDFSSDYADAAYITTGSEGDASLDRRYWAFILQNGDSEPIGVTVYNREADRVVGHREAFPDSVNFVSMDMSGRHCIIGYDSISYQILPRDLSGDGISLPEGAAGHGDAALTTDGRDVIVYQNVATDYISMADLDTGEETPLLAIPFEVNTDLGLHVSGNSSATPGWVLVSTYGSKTPPADGEHSWMDEQLFMLELKVNPRVWRLADTHSYTSLDYSAEKVYFAEAFAAINTSGTRAYFASNWEDMIPDYTDVYVLDLPDGWTAAVPATSS